jgi:hypothetical protein
MINRIANPAPPPRRFLDITILACTLPVALLSLLLYALNPFSFLFLVLGKVVGLTAQLIAMVILISQTPTVVLVLGGLAYLFGIMEGGFSFWRRVRV